MRKLARAGAVVALLAAGSGGSPALAQQADPPAPAPPTLERPAMVAAGLAVTVIGAVLVPIGASVYVSSPPCPTCFLDFSGIGRSAGVVSMVAGGLHLLVGVPLVVAGAVVPGRTTTPVTPRAVPSVAAGPRSVTLRWTF